MTPQSHSLPMLHPEGGLPAPASLLSTLCSMEQRQAGHSTAECTLPAQSCPTAQASERTAHGTCPIPALLTAVPVAALLLQVVDAGRDAGQAVHPLHHAVLLSASSAALQDLGDYRTSASLWLSSLFKSWFRLCSSHFPSTKPSRATAWFFPGGESCQRCHCRSW